MPKLNATQIQQKYKEHLHATLLDFSCMGLKDVQIPINWSDNGINRNSSNNDKGEIYELYIGSLYKSEGYDVIPTGGSNDMGIDLLCRQGNNYVICIQCKYRTDKGLGVKDIFEFYGACKYYASQHLNETVSGAFWTTQRFNKGTKMFRVAESLGIKFFSGVLLPKDFQC